MLYDQDAVDVYDSVSHSAEKQPVPAPGCISIGDYACRSDVTGQESGSQ